MTEKILFHDKYVEDLFEENTKEMKDHIENMSCSEFDDKSVKEVQEEVYQKFKIQNISLDLKDSKILSTGERSFVMGIPMQEGEDLLDYRPGVDCGAVCPSGRYEDGWLKKSFSVENGMDEVKEEIGSWKKTIDRYITSLDEAIVHYHKKVQKDVMDLLQTKKRRCEKSRGVIDQLGIMMEEEGGME